MKYNPGSVEAGVNHVLLSHLAPLYPGCVDADMGWDE